MFLPTHAVTYFRPASSTLQKSEAYDSLPNNITDHCLCKYGQLSLGYLITKQNNSLSRHNIILQRMRKHELTLSTKVKQTPCKISLNIFISLNIINTSRQHVVLTVYSQIYQLLHKCMVESTIVMLGTNNIHVIQLNVCHIPKRFKS